MALVELGRAGHGHRQQLVLLGPERVGDASDAKQRRRSFRRLAGRSGVGDRLKTLIFPENLLEARNWNAFHFAIGEWVAPHTDRELQLWWEATAPRSEDMQVSRSVSWVRRADVIVAVTSIRLPGDDLKGLRIFALDQQGELATVTLAESARYTDGVWRLQGARASSCRRSPVPR